jgi:hypothetical protein
MTGLFKKRWNHYTTAFAGKTVIPQPCREKGEDKSPDKNGCCLAVRTDRHTERAPEKHKRFREKNLTRRFGRW